MAKQEEKLEWHRVAEAVAAENRASHARANARPIPEKSSETDCRRRR